MTKYNWTPVFSELARHKLPASGAAKIAILVTMEFEGLSINGGVGTYYREIAHQLSRSGWKVILAAVGGQLAGLRDSSVPEVSAIFDVMRCEEFLHLRDVHQGLLQSCGSDGLAQLGLKCLFFLQAMQQHFHGARIFAEFHDMYGFGYHAAKARQAGLLGENVSVAVTMHSGHEWIFHANQSIFDYKAPDFIRIAAREEQSFASATLPMFPSDSLRRHVEDYGWDLSRACKIPYFVPLLPEFDTRQKQESERTAGEQASIVFFGRLEERKGLREFVQAINSCSATSACRFKIIFLGKNVHLHSRELSGLTSREYLEATLRPGLQWEVQSGYSSSEAAAFLQSLRDAVVCLASPTDNFPNAALEAAQLPFPLVVSDTLGFRQTLALVERSDGIFWFEPENANSLARALEAALLQSGRGSAHPSVVRLQAINASLLEKRLELIDRSFGIDEVRPTDRKAFVWVVCEQDLARIIQSLDDLKRLQVDNLAFGLKLLGRSIDHHLVNDIRSRYPGLVVDARTHRAEGDLLVDQDFRAAAFEIFVFMRWDVKFTESALTTFVGAALRSEATVFYCAEETPDAETPVVCHDAPNVLDILDSRVGLPACLAIDASALVNFTAPEALGASGFIDQLFAACIVQGFRCGYFAYPLYVVPGVNSKASASDATNRRMESLAYLGRLPSLGKRSRVQTLLALTQLSVQQRARDTRGLRARLPGLRRVSNFFRRIVGLLGGTRGPERRP